MYKSKLLYKFEFLMLHTVIWSRLIGRFFFKKRKKQIMIFYSRTNKRV